MSSASPHTPGGGGRPADRTTCAVVGGGPAGMVLGLLLARAGVKVTVLEKHADFLRDFRGDTVHPTTMTLLEDLGLFEQFDALPHSRISRIQVPLDDGTQVTVGDFEHLPLRHPYIAMVPQWDLLDLLAGAGRLEPAFELRMEHEVTGVVRDGERVTGVEYRSPEGDGRLLADLVVAADGRWSLLRREAGLEAKDFPVNVDVWWFRVPTGRDLQESLLPRSRPGRAVVVIPRRGYAQVAYIGPKGSDAELRSRGIESFRADVAEAVPELADDVHGIETLDDVKHLDVRVNRLRRWHAPGIVCIGDAAHAMSPIGGVGINLAVQDAVAAARLLARPLLIGDFAATMDAGGPSRQDRVLGRLRRRRLLPTVLTQSLQRLMHAQLLDRVIEGRISQLPRIVPWAVRRIPALSAVPAFLVGVGARPERAPRWARQDPPRDSHGRRRHRGRARR